MNHTKIITGIQSTVILKSLAYLGRPLWIVRSWWRRQNQRYGLRWRIANFTLAVLMIASVAIPVAQQLVQSSRYQLSADAVQLVGNTNKSLEKLLTYDSAQQQYQFNKDAIGGDSNLPAKLQKASLGTPASKDSSTYALDISQDFSRGVTYHDVNSQLSFSLQPEFSALAGKQVDGHVVFPLNGGNQAVYTLKGNGLKEDIVVPQVTQDSMTFSYQLKLPDTLEAKVIPNSDGAIGIYSADPSLFGNISYGSSADQAAVEKARRTADKNYLVFGLPSPTIKTQNGQSLGQASARFVLNGNQLSVVAENLAGLRGPISIDPSVVVTSTSDFQTSGNNESNIDFSTSGQINRAGLTGGGIAGTGWVNTIAMTTAASRQATIAYDGYLYVLGGENTSSAAIATVQYAALNATTGVIGTWATTTSFTTARYGLSADVYNGYMYILGGTTNGTTPFNDVQYALINSNGTLGTWATTTSFTTAVASLSADAYNGYMYILGGTTNSTAAVTTVQYAPINADGTLGSWVTNGTSLSGTGRYSFASTTYNGYLYVMGGRDASTIYNDVQYAPINSNGSLGSFTTTTSFTTARYYLSGFAYNGYLYIVGGYTSYMSDTQYAPINANGTIGAWKTTSSIATARYTPGGVAYNGYMYVVGGYNGTTLATAQYAKIDPAGTTSSFANILDGTGHNFTTARSLNCTVAYNGYLYVIGGSANDTAGNIGSIYFTAIGSSGSLTSWNSAASLPLPYASVGCAAYNGYLYVIGGRGGSSAVSTTYYAPITAGTGAITGWTSGTALPDTSIAPGAIAYNGYLYEVGGQQSVNGAVVNYAPLNATTGAIGSWTATSSLHDAYDYAAVVQSGKYIYNIGGTPNASSSSSVTEVQYALINANGTLGTWAVATNGLPAARSFMSGAASNGCIYALGGENTAGSSMSNVYYACPSSTGNITSAWQSAPSLATGTTDSSATAYHGYIYLSGGFTTTEVVTTQYAQINNGAPGVAGTWATTNAPTTSRFNQVNLAYNGYLYTLGGYDGANYLSDIQYAAINSNGTLGTWATTTSFLTGRRSAAAVAYNGYMYLLGGVDASSIYHNDVQYAPINANGTVGTWHYTHNSTDDGTSFVAGFTTGRQGHTSVAYKGYLYVIGGLAGGTERSDVQYAPINANGTVGTWASTTSFTTARYGHTSMVYNSYLYVVGGTDTFSNVYGDVQYAPINANGTVGTWASTSNLPTARYGHSMMAANGYVYVLGGQDVNGNYLGDVQYAPITNSGIIGPWSTTTSFATARTESGGVAYNGYLYLVNGYAGGGTPLTDTQYSPLSAIPRIAYYSKLLDLTVAVSVNSITYTGSLPSTAGTPSPINLRAAGTSLVSFGSTVSSSTIGTGSTTCTQLGPSNTRYLWIAITFDDSQTGIFTDSNGTLSDVADFTVNYTPVHAPPNIRLRIGQTLQTGNLTGFDLCSP